MMVRVLLYGYATGVYSSRIVGSVRAHELHCYQRHIPRGTFRRSGAGSRQ
jgi:hypothetical protein